MPKIHPPDTFTFSNTAFVKRTRSHLYLNKPVKQLKRSVLADLLTWKLTRTRTTPCRSPCRKTWKLKRTSCNQNLTDTDWNRTGLIPNFCLYLCQSNFYLSAPAARACLHPACLQICEWCMIHSSHGTAGCKPFLIYHYLPHIRFVNSASFVTRIQTDCLIALTLPGKTSDNSWNFDGLFILVYIGF